MVNYKIVKRTSIKPEIVNEYCYSSFSVLLEDICFLQKDHEPTVFRFGDHYLILEGEFENYPFNLRSKFNIAKGLLEILSMWKDKRSTDLCNDYLKNGCTHELVHFVKDGTCSDEVKRFFIPPNNAVSLVALINHWYIPFDLRDFILNDNETLRKLCREHSDIDFCFIANASDYLEVHNRDKTNERLIYVNPYSINE